MENTYEFFLQLHRRFEGKRLLVVGIGNEMCGDDGLGPRLIAALQGRVGAQLLDAGDVPENFLGKICSLRPEVIFIVDAADIGGEPGDIAVLETDELPGLMALTHNPGLRLFTYFLQQETGAQILVMAVQPGGTSPGAGISPAVQRTLNCLVGLFQYMDGDDSAEAKRAAPGLAV